MLHLQVSVVAGRVRPADCGISGLVFRLISAHFLAGGEIKNSDCFVSKRNVIFPFVITSLYRMDRPVVMELNDPSLPDSLMET